MKLPLLKLSNPDIFINEVLNVLKSNFLQVLKCLKVKPLISELSKLKLSKFRNVETSKTTSWVGYGWWVFLSAIGSYSAYIEIIFIEMKRPVCTWLYNFYIIFALSGGLGGSHYGDFICIWIGKFKGPTEIRTRPRIACPNWKFLLVTGLKYCVHMPVFDHKITKAQ